MRQGQLGVGGILFQISVYKNPYNNCCQMSFFPLTTHQNHVGCGFAQTPLEELTALVTSHWS